MLTALSPVGIRFRICPINVYPGFRIRLSSIPDPGSGLSPSRIQILIKEFKYFNPRKGKKGKKLVSKL
jgi:hypothetical protein